MDINEFAEELEEWAVTVFVDNDVYSFRLSESGQEYILYECKISEFTAAIALCGILMAYAFGTNAGAFSVLPVREHKVKRIMAGLKRSVVDNKVAERGQSKQPIRLFGQQVDSQPVKTVGAEPTLAEPQTNVYAPYSKAFDPQALVPDGQTAYGALFVMREGQVIDGSTDPYIDGEFGPQRNNLGAIEKSLTRQMEPPPGTAIIVPGASPRVVRDLSWG